MFGFSFTWPCINTMLLCSIIILLIAGGFKIFCVVKKFQDKVDFIDAKITKAQIEIADKFLERLLPKE